MLCVRSQMLIVDTVILFFLLRGMAQDIARRSVARAVRRYAWINALFSLRDSTPSCPRPPGLARCLPECPRSCVKVCNNKQLGPFARCPLRLRKYDLIVVSHVAAGVIDRVLFRDDVPRRTDFITVFTGYVPDPRLARGRLLAYRTSDLRGVPAGATSAARYGQAAFETKGSR